jgi:NitT/TauT family transport system permease protein
VVNVATGIATVEPELRDVLRALGASPTDIIRKVGLPRAMPYFFASLKVAITVAFVGSIISETVAANEGIGHLMLVASSRFDVPLVFAGLIITGVMGVAMYWVAVTIEERTTGWATRGQQDPRLAAGG